MVGMARVTHAVLWAVVLSVAGGLLVSAIGVAEPYVSPSDLPLTPPQAVGASFGILILGVILSKALDALAWRRTGKRAGLTPDGGLNPVGKPALTGTVHGRDVRARTDTRGGGNNSPSRTYTVVETTLQTPVEWTAMVAPADSAEIHHLPSVDTDTEHWTTIDDQFAVWGDISEEQMRGVLSGRVREMLRTLGSGVMVGDVGEEVLNQFAASIPDDADGVSATAASGLLGAVGADGESEHSRQVTHKDRGALYDADELERRAEAVAAVAEAVERSTAH